MTSLLSRWLRPRGANRSVAVTVYTREGCGCCERALATLRRFEKRFGLEIELVDVDADPALAEEHGLSVPVVRIGDKVRFRGVVNPALLERLLAAPASARGEEA